MYCYGINYKGRIIQLVNNKIKNKVFIKRKFIRISYTLNLQYIHIVIITTHLRHPLVSIEILI